MLSEVASEMHTDNFSVMEIPLKLLSEIHFFCSKYFR